MTSPTISSRPHRAAWRRALALAGVTLAGLASLVGSGGGGFPGCEGITCVNTPIPPAVRLEPDVATVAVGASPSFTVQMWEVTGAVRVQWQRSANGGLSYTDIAGATAPTLTLPTANLTDDGLRVRATVSALNGTSTATGQVAVSATPAVVLADSEFDPAQWLLVTVPLIGQADSGSSIDERLTSGGTPGAFRRSTVQIGNPTGLSRQLGLWLPVAYDPRLQGAIRQVDQHVDCIDLNPSDTRGTEVYAALEQAGRRYQSRRGVLCRSSDAWRSNTLGGLQAADFDLTQGPACAPGEACPDFSATGGPIRFGEYRLHMGRGGDIVVHGTDNWRVSVWRR